MEYLEPNPLSVEAAWRMKESTTELGDASEPGRNGEVSSNVVHSDGFHSDGASIWDWKNEATAAPTGVSSVAAGKHSSVKDVRSNNCLGDMAGGSRGVRSTGDAVDHLRFSRVSRFTKGSVGDDDTCRRADEGRC